MARCGAQRAAALALAVVLLVPTLTFVLGASGTNWARKENCQSPPMDAEALFDYGVFYNCFEVIPKLLKLALLAVWLALLISLLATTADLFFVPQLGVLSDKLGLSEDVAGVTLLALGNGMPDVMTAASAINKASDLPLTMGEFFGAANFILSFVLGCVLLCQSGPTPAAPRAILRDSISYTLVILLMLWTTWDGTITRLESSVFLIAYVAYVALVVFLERHCQPAVARSRSMSRLMPWAFTPRVGERWQGPAAPSPALFFPQGCGAVEAVEQHGRRQEGATAEPENETERATPADQDGEADKLEGLDMDAAAGIFECVQLVMEIPFTLARHASIPAANWNPKRRLLSAICPTFGMLLGLLSFGGWEAFSKRLGPLPLWSCCALLGILCFGGVLRFSSSDEPPQWHVLMLLFAFASVVGWFNLLANECVAVLELFGINLGISSQILGITVLAWGNSVGDLVADTAVARQGKSKTAVAGCFGSPLLSDLLGLGVAFMARTLTKGDLKAKLKRQNKVAAGFVLLSMASTVIAFASNRFRCPRMFAWILLAQYAAFMVTSVLLEAEIL